MGVFSWPKLGVLLAAGGLLGWVVVVEGKVVEGKGGRFSVLGCLILMTLPRRAWAVQRCWRSRSLNRVDGHVDN